MGNNYLVPASEEYKNIRVLVQNERENWNLVFFDLRHIRIHHTNIYFSIINGNIELLNVTPPHKENKEVEQQLFDMTGQSLARIETTYSRNCRLYSGRIADKIYSFLKHESTISIVDIQRV